MNRPQTPREFYADRSRYGYIYWHQGLFAVESQQILFAIVAFRPR